MPYKSLIDLMSDITLDLDTLPEETAEMKLILKMIRDRKNKTYTVKVQSALPYDPDAEIGRLLGKGVEEVEDVDTPEDAYKRAMKGVE